MGRWFQAQALIGAFLSVQSPILGFFSWDQPAAGCWPLGRLCALPIPTRCYQSPWLPLLLLGDLIHVDSAGSGSHWGQPLTPLSWGVCPGLLIPL